MRFMLYIFLPLMVAYCALMGLLYRFQRKLIYHPNKEIGTPPQYGLAEFSEYFVTTTDNETIQLWYRPATRGYPTIVYYHGNAYNLSSRAGIYSALASKGFGVLAVSYRGYGKSSGSQSEDGLYTDARVAIQFLTDKFHIMPPEIMLFGESLGTGVAVQMAMEYNVSAVILQSPYTSVAARAAEIHNYIPVTLLIKDQYATINKIAYMKAPLLLFHGERDQVIPVAHGRTVFAAATAPKEAFFFPNVDHNDFDSSAISAHVLDFAETHKLIKH